MPSEYSGSAAPLRQQSVNEADSLLREFPVIPVKPGIFSRIREKCSLSTEKSTVNQSPGGQFPLPL
jgi:hypothetical protein